MASAKEIPGFEKLGLSGKLRRKDFFGASALRVTSRTPFQPNGMRNSWIPPDEDDRLMMMDDG